MGAKFFLLLLHAHMPYSLNNKGDCLEERWLYEALTDCYLPLVEIMDSWLQDELNFKITLSLSPPLLSMLTDRRIKERYLAYLRALIELAEKEEERTRQEAPAFYPLANYYRERFVSKEKQYLSLDGDLLLPLKDLIKKGKLELATCTATHAFLPLVKEEVIKIAQIRAAREYLKAFFGAYPESFWLPECGYTPGLDSLLAEEGISCIFLVPHGLAVGPQRRRRSCFPVKSHAGISVFFQDQELSKQVWSSSHGYPSDPFYREYYRDIAFDLPPEKLVPFFVSCGKGLPTGIKYFRITGRGPLKEIYCPATAQARAQEHARHFLNVLQRRLDIERQSDGAPVVAALFDAELFGHWWFEGPCWLDRLIRLLNGQKEITMVTPRQYLEEYPPRTEAELYPSSWGKGGCYEVWLNEKNDFFYPTLHAAEKRIMALCRDYYDYGCEKEHPLLKLLGKYLQQKDLPSLKVQERVLIQALKELFLAQSSDWAFMLSWQKAEDVALGRFCRHLERFNLLCEMYSQGKYSQEKLEAYEQEDALLGGLGENLWPKESDGDLFRKSKLQQDKKLRVLFLSWEFPPRIIGGLGRHVAGLSRALAAQGIQMFVITLQGGIKHSQIEQGDGVNIFRLFLNDSSHSGDLLEWAASLNATFFREGAALLRSWPRLFPAVIHAHDWMVAPCAIALKEEFGLPLVATIHSTEWGRRQGSFTELQRHIHSLEKDLALKADRVICCSGYMKNEIVSALCVPEQKVEVLPNGVDPEDLKPYRIPAKSEEGYIPEGKKVVFFVGRLVYEKGVHLLIEAACRVKKEIPQAYFVVAGTGPQKEALKEKALALGLGDSLVFVDFIDDELRNYYYRRADVAVFPSLYEPFGIVALEAMAAGASVIVADCGGLREIVGGGEGLKFPAGNSWALGDCILTLLKDEHLKAKLRQKAREKVKKEYRWSVIARKTAEIYASLLF